MSTIIRTELDFCCNCGNETKCDIIRQPVKINFEGEEYLVEEEFLKCQVCGEEYIRPDLLDPLSTVIAAYRKKMGFPTADEIGKLRENLKLNEKEFASLLNTTDRTIRMYEKGALPRDEHGFILKQLAEIHGILPKVRPEEKLNSPLNLADMKENSKDVKFSDIYRILQKTPRERRCKTPSPNSAENEVDERTMVA